MKLNNNGWGLSEMIVFSAILIIALFFVVFYSFQFKKEDTIEPTKQTTNESIQESITYPTIENKIREATRTYMQKYYDGIISGEITIPTSNLIYNHLLEENDLKTSDKDTCDGYALVYKKENQDYEIEAYIKCNNYKTNEFQDWRIGEANE